jgi:hypothetical protein
MLAADGDGLEQCILAVRDRGQVKHRVLLHHAVIADVFAERALRLGVALGIEITLQHVFGVGRHVDVAGNAFDDRHRRAAQRPQHLKLVHRRVHADRRHEIARRRADHIGDRRLLALRHRFEIDRPGIARRDHIDAGGARSAQHDAAAADVVMAGVAELHDVEAGGNVGRAVFAVLQMHRQRAEIGLLALQHHLLHRGVRRRDLHRLVRTGETLRDRREQPCLVGVERKRKTLARSHDVADQLGLLRADRLEPGRARIAVQHGADLDQIDRLVVHLAFAELHQTLDVAAEAETFGVGSHAVPWIATMT